MGVIFFQTTWPSEHMNIFFVSPERLYTRPLWYFPTSRRENVVPEMILHYVNVPDISSVYRFIDCHKKGFIINIILIVGLKTKFVCALGLGLDHHTWARWNNYHDLYAAKHYHMPTASLKTRKGLFKNHITHPKGGCQPLVWEIRFLFNL